MPAYSIRIVRDLAMAVQPALYDDERPRFVGPDGSIQPAAPGLVVTPAPVSVFINTWLSSELLSPWAGEGIPRSYCGPSGG
jgi:hypothetical protein